jgi:acetoin utilization deacetylase AcuC-like enzyme
MTVALLTHAAAARHITPPGHPEQVARLAAVLGALDGPAFAGLARHDARPATEAELLRAHAPAYLAALRDASPAAGSVALDADTHISPGSLTAARLGAGAGCQAVDMVMAGDARAVFAAMRPPGHHAERARAMGFCLYSNAAIAALHALEHHGLERIAVLDFDVHHGNGTQDVLERDPRAFVASSHEWPLWPGTGAAAEVGVGNVLNVPIPTGAGSAGFRAAWRDAILPRAAAHRPQMVFISAGFDAHRRDPLAGLMVETEDFAWITREIMGLAAQCCAGRVVSLLEGGYDLGALAESAGAHVRAMMEETA